MTMNECIKQLESLRAHCDAMCDGKLDSMDCWDKDVEALDMALEILKSPDRPLTEDEINEMLEAIRNAPATPMPVEPVIEPVIRWISVKDKLPPQNMRVLVYRPEMVNADIGPISVRWGWSVKRNASHWQPLPEPPEEVKKKIQEIWDKIAAGEQV